MSESKNIALLTNADYAFPPGLCAALAGLCAMLEIMTPPGFQSSSYRSFSF